MKLIILDRDGVINYESDVYIKSPDEWQPLPGSLQAMAQLTAADYRIAIATNQAGIAHGLYDTKTLDAIHNKMQRLARAEGAVIDYITYCPHRNEDNCQCRKPKPGMLLEIAQFFDVELQTVYFIGDSFRDMQAAKAAGCQGMLVKTGYGEKTLADNPQLEVPVFINLAEAVQTLL